MKKSVRLVWHLFPGAILLFAAVAAARVNPYSGEKNARAGAKLFARHCAACHGEAGGGVGKAPALRSPVIRNMADPALFRILTQGVMRRGMPSWAHLPEAQRWQIIAYLKSLR